MENQNQQNPIPTSVPTPPSPLQSNKLAKLKELIDAKLVNFTPQQKKMIYIAGGVFTFAIVLLIIGSLVKVLRGPQVVLPTPTPPEATSSPFPSVSGLGRPSIYATDSAVLKIETGINDAGTRVDAIDVQQSQLRPPEINFFVSFGE